MILHSPECFVQLGLHLAVTYEYVVEEDEDGEPWDREVETFHIPISATAAACGTNIDFIDAWRWTPPNRHNRESECEECWRLLREGSGSIPPEDPTYGTEAGFRNRNIGDVPHFQAGVHGECDSVGIAEGAIFLDPRSRDEWATLSVDRQRQAAISATGVWLRQRSRRFGGRPVFHIVPGPAESGISFVVPRPDYPGT